VGLSLFSTYILPSNDSHKYLPFATALLSEDSAEEYHFGIGSVLLFLLYLSKQYDVHIMLVKVKQSRYRPGVAQRVPGS